MTLAFTDKVLAQTGVKGMHWGVRKGVPTSSLTAPEAVKLKVVPGKRVKAAGGGRAYPPSKDAKTATAYAQIARSSSSSALSNKQLQTVVTRMKLEQEWQKVNTADYARNRSTFNKLFNQYKHSEMQKISQGKTPTTVVLAKLLQQTVVPSVGKHVKP